MYIEIQFMANPHPIQVNPRISLLRTLEGFGFVSGLPFPDKELVCAWPAVSGMTGNGLDITADSFDDFPRCHVAVDAPCQVFYQRQERWPIPLK
jgi:hypothetical protein